MVRHPLIDDVVGPAIVVESSAPVVWLTDALASLLARAATSERLVVLRTEADAAITPALRHALGAHGAAWAVTDRDGSLRDGRTGVRATSIDDFVLRGPELSGTPSPEHPVAPHAVPQVSIDLTLRHHPDREINVGGALEALCDAADSCPERWGTAEPLTVPWDRWVVTQYAKHRAPDVSTSYAIGDGMAATMTAHMTNGFVVETLSAMVTEPDGGVDAVLDAVREVANDVVPVFGVVMRRHGDPDHMVRAVSYGEPEPAAVVVGPEATAFLDRSGHWPPADTRIETFGSDDHEGLLVRFDSGWDALEAFLDRMDEDRFLTLVGGGPLEPAQAEGALDEHDARTLGGAGAP
ncbi:DUF6177 family protein [Curtobacterium sp. MCBD17_028]|uniref:DUF6177 family protein n=1 Tax=Curtobacterium sp. MCBD17_028 TaxID=2175670 RepID=UPI000DAA626A|nr:DUF6177 family protein [Curtobacterium sp. MCBD17_028]PZE27992.1 hypothetical protein DEI86_05210 [Curtobacterium sp. MCBD17_028]